VFFEIEVVKQPALKRKPSFELLGAL
jgi:hypothetical protein